MGIPNVTNGAVGFSEDVRGEADLEFEQNSEAELASAPLMSSTTLGSDVAQDEHATLAESVRECVEQYISTMGDEEISNLYELVLSEVEAPLIQSVLDSTHNNQSKTALMLGLNRGTLRKKLRKYGML
jgi:Fis family transcriptional regulator